MGQEHDEIVGHLSGILREIDYWESVTTELEYTSTSHWAEKPFGSQGDVDVMAVHREENRIHLYCCEIKTNWTTNYGTGERHPTRKNERFASYWAEKVEDRDYDEVDITTAKIHDTQFNTHNSPPDRLEPGKGGILVEGYEKNRRHHARTASD